MSSPISQDTRSTTPSKESIVPAVEGAPVAAVCRPSEVDKKVGQDSLDEKTCVGSHGQPDTEQAADRDWTEDLQYPDGGLHAWLVVLGCFLFASTCM